MSAIKAEEVTETRLAVVPPMSVEGLIAKAIEANISVESLEKLLGMRERLKDEAAREAFIESMSGFQSEVPVIEKKKTAVVKNQQGAVSYTYKFAPLEDIVEATQVLRRKYGFSYRFDTKFEAQPPAQVVLCIVQHRDGYSESSEFRAPIDSSARMNIMQQSASSLTYAKRYAFCNAFGILTGDEDNDGATTPAAGGQRTTRATAAPASEARDAASAAEPEPSPAQQAKDARIVAKAQKKHEEGAGAVRAAREATQEVEAEDVATLYQEIVELGVVWALKKNPDDPDSQKSALELLDRQCVEMWGFPLDKLNVTALKTLLASYRLKVEADV